MVTTITRTGRGTVLAADGPSGRHRVALDAAPDGAAARRRLATCRRIDRVEFRVSADQVRAVIRGTRHRLPFAGPVPVGVALGLTELGVRTTIVKGSA